MEKYLQKHKCRICGKEGLSLFKDMKINKDWKGNYMPDRCKECWNFYCREYRKSRKGTASWTKYNQERALKYKYGIDLEEYNKLYELHLGGCAICKKACERNPKVLSVDHDHKTGKIRGLLCNNCNAALGFLKEDEDIIWNLLDYLKNKGVVNDPQPFFNGKEIKQENHYETVTVRE